MKFLNCLIPYKDKLNNLELRTQHYLTPFPILNMSDVALFYFTLELQIYIFNNTQ